MEDIDLLLDVANNIEGNTICALGDAAAWPVQSVIKKFRMNLNHVQEKILLQLRMFRLLIWSVRQVNYRPAPLP